MPFFPNKNDEKQEPTWGEGGAGSKVDPPTRDLGRKPGQNPVGRPNDGDTVPMGKVDPPRPVILASSPSPTPVPVVNDPATHVYLKKPLTPSQTSHGVTPESAPQHSYMSDPPVGWVVVVEGFGQGAFRQIGYGTNAIGRAKESRICLDFGDESISRENHAIITYDDVERMFFIHHGGGKNVTRVNNKIVLVPVQLTTGQEITLGATRLRFVPLCGSDFEWQKG